MKKITLFQTMLLTIALFAGSTSAWAQTCDKADDFTTLTANSQYGTRTTTNG